MILAAEKYKRIFRNAIVAKELLITRSAKGFEVSVELEESMFFYQSNLSLRY
jgi:hypothetical protein